MDIFKNKLFILLLIAVLVLGVRLWAKATTTQISQDKLIDWITIGYSQQFCNVIFPHINKCVTLDSPQCMEVARKNITTCIIAEKSRLPHSLEPQAAKEIYNSMGTCFADNMHTELLNNYLVKSWECEQRMS